MQLTLSNYEFKSMIKRFPKRTKVEILNKPHRLAKMPSV